MKPNRKFSSVEIHWFVVLFVGLKQTELDKPWIGQSSLGGKQVTAVKAEPAAAPAASVAVAAAAAVAPAPAPETASTTVFIPTHSNLKHESLQRIWNLRNQMKLIKRNYQQFGEPLCVVL